MKVTEFTKHQPAEGVELLSTLTLFPCWLFTGLPGFSLLSCEDTEPEVQPKLGIYKSPALQEAGTDSSILATMVPSLHFESKSDSFLTSSEGSGCFERHLVQSSSLASVKKGDFCVLLVQLYIAKYFKKLICLYISKVTRPRDFSFWKSFTHGHSNSQHKLKLKANISKLNFSPDEQKSPSLGNQCYSTDWQNIPSARATLNSHISNREAGTRNISCWEQSLEESSFLPQFRSAGSKRNN